MGKMYSKWISPHLLAAGTDLHVQFAGTEHRAKREIIQVWTQSVFSVLKMGRLLYG